MPILDALKFPFMLAPNENETQRFPHCYAISSPYSISLGQLALRPASWVNCMVRPLAISMWKVMNRSHSATGSLPKCGWSAWLSSFCHQTSTLAVSPGADATIYRLVPSNMLG